MENIVSVFQNNLPWVWVAVTIICVVIESLTLSLTTIWFGISAFVMVFLAFTPLPFPAQLFIFVAVAMVLLIFTKPLVKKKLSQKKIATNILFSKKKDKPRRKNKTSGSEPETSGKFR